MIDYAPMLAADLGEALALWTATEGIGVRGADSPAELASYLGRNPGLSLVAREHAQLVGAILCGHDGRRGFLYHLAVVPAQRRRGIGAQLVTRSLDALRRVGIAKCHLMVFAHNAEGRAFWRGNDWHERDDIVVMSHNLTSNPNA